MSKVICKAGPIIGLVGIGKLSLLWELFDEVSIPEAVKEEVCVKTDNREVLEINKSIENGYIKVIRIGNTDLIESLSGKLHRGELETIIGAKTEPDIQFAVIDEKAARSFAASMLVDTIGVLGILRHAKAQGKIDAVKPHIDKLMQNGYRISEALYNLVLNKENEQFSSS